MAREKVQLSEAMKKPSTPPCGPIRAFREAHKGKRGLPMSYETFGQKFQVDKTTARYWELSRVPAERAAAIAQVVGCHPHALRPDVFPAP